MTLFPAQMLHALMLHALQALDAAIPILTNQVQYSLLDRRPALYMQQLCARRGVKMLAYGTLAGGFLSHKYLGMPAGRARLDTVGKVKYGRIITQYGGWTLLQASSPGATAFS